MDMPLEGTVNAERIHISFFGMTNSGKSSLVNMLTGQETALVSDIRGTTTDPVKKAMELFPLGPVLMIDTPGLDDESLLGAKRIERTKRILDQTDIAVVVISAETGITKKDEELIGIIKGRKIPFITVMNKSDLTGASGFGKYEDAVYVSALNGDGREALLKKLSEFKPDKKEKDIIGDLLSEGDIAVLVTPIDESAPKERLILPQQLTIRSILDKGASAIITREHEYISSLKALKKAPELVITDSQVFDFVNKNTDSAIPLTSFSILFARYKGFLQQAVDGAMALDNLEDGDTVLISEGCTHHRQCGDIGSVKLPEWIGAYTGKNLKYEFTSGGDFPQDVQKYRLIVHCGGCMLNEKEVSVRAEKASLAGVPMTNYGILIAHINGILKRSTSML